MNFILRFYSEKTLIKLSRWCEIEGNPTNIYATELCRRWGELA